MFTSSRPGSRFDPLTVSAANYDVDDISTLNDAVLQPGAYNGVASSGSGISVTWILIVCAVLFLIWKVK